MERPNRRLSNGLQRLEAWSRTASQIEKNAAYDALFAVANGSVSRTHKIMAAELPQDFVVQVRENLIIRVRLMSSSAFGIQYIGPRVAETEGGIGHAA